MLLGRCLVLRGMQWKSGNSAVGKACINPCRYWEEEWGEHKGEGISLFQICGGAVTESPLWTRQRTRSKVLREPGVSGIPAILSSMGKAEITPFDVMV